MVYYSKSLFQLHWQVVHDAKKVCLTNKSLSNLTQQAETTNIWLMLLTSKVGGKTNNQKNEETYFSLSKLYF